MFMTTPILERFVPKTLLPDGVRCWAGFAIEVELPWFLVRLVFEDDERKALRTLVIGNENGLIDLLQSVDATNVASVQCMALSAYPKGVWQMREVLEVWYAADDERRDAGPLVFQFRNQAGRFGSALQPVTMPDRSRSLLLSLVRQ